MWFVVVVCTALSAQTCPPASVVSAARAIPYPTEKSCDETAAQLRRVFNLQYRFTGTITWTCVK